MWQQTTYVTLKVEVSDPHVPAAACIDILQSINCHLEVSAVSTTGSIKWSLEQAGDLHIPEATCLYIDDLGSVVFLGVGFRVSAGTANYMYCDALQQ